MSHQIIKRLRENVENMQNFAKYCLKKWCEKNMKIWKIMKEIALNGLKKKQKDCEKREKCWRKCVKYVENPNKNWVEICWKIVENWSKICWKLLKIGVKCTEKSLKIGVKYAEKLTKVAWKMSENLKIQFYVTFLDLYP